MGIFNIFGKKGQKQEKANKKIVVNPVQGEIIPLQDVEDEAFANGAMGPGVGIRPDNGMIYAPVSGELCAVFPTGHAVGIRSEEGIEILIHIGIDTVNMEGDGFSVKVKQGEYVKAGDLLVEVDLDKVRVAGYKTTIMLLVTNASDVGKLTDIRTGFMEIQQPVFAIDNA